MAYLQRITATPTQGGHLGEPPLKVTAKIGLPPQAVQGALHALAPVPAAQPHVEPPPYDAALDPAWHGVLDPNDHELRNLLNNLSPEERQVILVRIGRAAPPVAATAAPQGV